MVDPAPVPNDQGELHDPPTLCKKAVNSFGPPIVVRSKLAAVLSLMVMAARHILTVMPSVRCFSVTGEYSTKSF